jgi:DNA modification methylase
VETNEEKSTHQEKLNDLSRAEWLKYSISVWGDVRPAEEDRRFKEKHPATFPLEIPLRVIKIFTHKGDWVLDPFLGTGTTLVACKQLGRNGIGVDISEEFANLARERLRQTAMSSTPTRQIVHCDDSRNLLKYLDEQGSLDLVFTSPPYWRILKEEKTFLKREASPYTTLQGDLGNTLEYEDFLRGLIEVFSTASKALKPGKFLVVDLMDVRIGDKFYPLHVDLISRMKEIMFELWDMVIWDRHMEYNSLSAMRYPYAFYVNKVHEYLLMFRKSDTEHIEPTQAQAVAKPTPKTSRSNVRSRPFGRPECTGCQYRASNYCWKQCPYNIWKKSFW